MMYGEGFNLPEYTGNQHNLIGAKPDPARANAWKNNLSFRDVEIFENITGDLLISLGYQQIFNGQANGLKWKERFSLKIKYLLMYPLNLLDQLKVFLTGRRYS